jgi:hypothetical protein
MHNLIGSQLIVNYKVPISGTLLMTAKSAFYPQSYDAICAQIRFLILFMPSHGPVPVIFPWHCPSNTIGLAYSAYDPLASNNWNKQ